MNIDITKILRKKTAKTGPQGSIAMRENVESNALLRFLKILVNGVLDFLGVGNALKGWYVKS